MVTLPIEEHQTSQPVCSLLVCNSSLFVGLFNGDIEEWNSAGEVERTLKGHSNSVYCLLQCGDVLWSGSSDRTICLWNVPSGGRIKILKTRGKVSSMVMW